MCSFQAHAKTFTFQVNMSCGACANKIEQALIENHKDAYENLTIDPDKNLISLESESLTQKELIKTIEKKAKYKVLESSEKE